jgi:hypothetical protein
MVDNPTAVSRGILRAYGEKGDRYIFAKDRISKNVPVPFFSSKASALIDLETMKLSKTLRLALIPDAVGAHLSRPFRGHRESSLRLKARFFNIPGGDNNTKGARR